MIVLQSRFRGKVRVVPWWRAPQPAAEDVLTTGTGRTRSRCGGVQLARRVFVNRRSAAMIIAAVYRAYRARKRYQRKRAAVIVVQRLVRGFLERRRYRALRKHVEYLQASVRVALAIQVLQGLHAEQTESPEARKVRADNDAQMRADILQRQEEADRLDVAKRKVRRTATPRRPATP